MPPSLRALFPAAPPPPSARPCSSEAFQFSVDAQCYSNADRLRPPTAVGGETATSSSPPALGFRPCGSERFLSPRAGTSTPTANGANGWAVWRPWFKEINPGGVATQLKRTNPQVSPLTASCSVCCGSLEEIPLVLRLTQISCQRFLRFACCCSCGAGTADM